MTKFGRWLRKFKRSFYRQNRYLTDELTMHTALMTLYPEWNVCPFCNKTYEQTSRVPFCIPRLKRVYYYRDIFHEYANRPRIARENMRRLFTREYLRHRPCFLRRGSKRV